MDAHEIIPDVSKAIKFTQIHEITINRSILLLIHLTPLAQTRFCLTWTNESPLLAGGLGIYDTFVNVLSVILVSVNSRISICLFGSMNLAYI